MVRRKKKKRVSLPKIEKRGENERGRERERGGRGTIREARGER